MVAKIICWAEDRAHCIARMEAALKGMVVEGIKTTIPFHLRALGNAHFRRGEVDTSFIERHMTGS
jgi:acetyl-CoA carboxylase biotin carboxylase subunit